MIILPLQSRDGLFNDNLGVGADSERLSTALMSMHSQPFLPTGRMHLHVDAGHFQDPKVKIYLLTDCGEPACQWAHNTDSKASRLMFILDLNLPYLTLPTRENIVSNSKELVVGGLISLSKNIYRTASYVPQLLRWYHQSSQTNFSSGIL